MLIVHGDKKKFFFYLSDGRKFFVAECHLMMLLEMFSECFQGCSSGRAHFSSDLLLARFSENSSQLEAEFPSYENKLISTDLNAAGVKQLSGSVKKEKMSGVIAKIDLTESEACLQGKRTWLFMASSKMENFTRKIAPPAVHLITFLRHITGSDSKNVALCRWGKSFWILIDVKERIIDARFSFLFRVFYRFSIVGSNKESSWL